MFKKIAATLLLLPTIALATFNYAYGPGEYVTISNGISPNGEYALTTHGEGEYGEKNFHVYLFNAKTGKKIGALEEIKEPLDTGAGAFVASWEKDDKVIVIYRVSRHEPLKAMTYELKEGRASPQSKKPKDVSPQSPLLKIWQKYGSNPAPTQKTFKIP